MCVWRSIFTSVCGGGVRRFTQIASGANQEVRMKSRYDVVILVAGHNGLVAAAYLARAGLSVLLLEKNDYIGGATPRKKSSRITMPHSPVTLIWSVFSRKKL